jgi:hypothetical protein
MVDPPIRSLGRGSPLLSLGSNAWMLLPLLAKVPRLTGEPAPRSSEAIMNPVPIHDATTPLANA